MAKYFEDYFPDWLSGVNFKKTVTFTGGVTLSAGTVNFSGATISNATFSGVTTFANGTIISGSGAYVGTTSSSNAIAVGQQGTTNPAFRVDASATTQRTGLYVKAAAAGAGLAVSVLSSGSNENLTIDALGTGTIAIGSTSTGQVAIGRGSLKSEVTSSTITSLGTTQNSTPTAAQLVGGVVTQTGQTGAGTVTLDNGTNISAAIAGVTVGDTFNCIFANLGGGQTLTITSATGATVVGNGAVPTGKNALMIFVNTGTNTWNVYVNVSA